MMRHPTTPIESTPPNRNNRPMAGRRRGVAIVLVIVAVAAAAIIGSAYVASQLNTPQIVGNVNAGIEARYIADSGADLATAIMECETFDWRTAHVNGVLVDNLPIGNGALSIRVADLNGADPDSTCEYPVIVAKGTCDSMNQVVGALVHAPRPEVAETSVTVDLSEFALFGASSIDVVFGSVSRWRASPLGSLGLPVKLGTNGTTSGRLMIRDDDDVPDGRGYVLATASASVIDDGSGGQPVPRVNITTNEALPLPAAPTPNFSGLTWSAVRSPYQTSNATRSYSGDTRYSSVTVDSGAVLTLDLGGAHRTIGISGGLTIQNGAALSIQNGTLDLVIQGSLNMFNKGAIELEPGVTLRIFQGGTMSINDSVIGLPRSWRYASRDAKDELSEYHNPARCTIYRLTSISSVDLNLLDGDDATSWSWSNNTLRSWLINDHSYVCAKIYGYNKAALSIDNQAAVYGHAVADSIIIANDSAVYYDHSLDAGCGYTNPDSKLFAGPLDLRDDMKLLLTDLNQSTIDAVVALIGGVAPPPVAIDPFAPTPRDKKRVSKRWWRRYGVKLKRDRESPVESVIAAGG